MTSLIVVRAAYDEEARVWTVVSSDLPGLNAEAPTVDVPIGLIAHASTRVRLLAA